MKYLKLLRGISAIMLCLSLFAAFAVTDPVRVRADEWTNFVNKCDKSMISFAQADTGLSSEDIIGYAYLVGTDNMADKSWIRGYGVHDLYAVDPDVRINGKAVNPKYLPQDNNEYLIKIKEEYLVENPKITDAIYRKPEGFQGTQREGTMFLVFDCDEEWVTVYESGFQIWRINNGILACTSDIDAYMETHPAGFYKVRRDEVWLDLKVNLPVNHPYNSKKEIPNKGTGVVTDLVKLRPYPNEDEATDWKSTPAYALPTGTKVKVVSTELVPSETPGSTRKYYKVSFNGSKKVQNNLVNYLSYVIPGVFYVDSQCLNFTKKGEKTPEGAVLGEISNTDSPVYAYASKDTASEKAAVLSKGAELQTLPNESDADWTTVIFSGKNVYVKTKYIKKGTYKVKDISNLHLADIVNNELIIKWDPGVGNVDYSCTIKAVGSKKIIWSNSHVKENQLTVKSKYMQQAVRGINAWIVISVQANDKNGSKGKKQEYSFDFGSLLPINKSLVQSERTSVCMMYYDAGYGNRQYISMFGESVQISADKNFKKARIVEYPYKENGETKYKNIYEIKNLKPNTTYYIRRRYTKKFKTAAGEKELTGPWSKAIAVRTKN